MKQPGYDYIQMTPMSYWTEQNENELASLARDNVVMALNGTHSEPHLNEEIAEWFEDFIFNAEGDFKSELICFFKEMALERFSTNHNQSTAFISTRHAFDRWLKERICAEKKRIRGRAKFLLRGES